MARSVCNTSVYRNLARSQSEYICNQNCGRITTRRFFTLQAQMGLTSMPNSAIINTLDELLQTYRKEQVDMRGTLYNVDQVLELSVAIDREQGFIRSGYGITDESGKFIADNKSRMISVLNGEGTVEITEQDKEKAVELKDYFSTSLTFKKLGVTLNDFEDAVLKIVNNEQTDSFGVSVAASLPNSMRHSSKRDTVKETLDALIAVSAPVGKLNQRSKFDLDVIDVTYIKKMGVHMVTCLEKKQNVVKFWFSKDPDISGVFENRSITVTGFVKSQGKSKYSNCMETMINRVKIESIKG